MSKSAVQVDWEEREYLEGLISNVKKVTDFLNKFGTAHFFCLCWLVLFLPPPRCSRLVGSTESSTRHRLALINARLSALELKMSFMEAALATVPQ